MCLYHIVCTCKFKSQYIRDMMLYMYANICTSHVYLFALPTCSQVINPIFASRHIDFCGRGKHTAGCKQTKLFLMRTGRTHGYIQRESSWHIYLNSSECRLCSFDHLWEFHLSAQLRTGRTHGDLLWQFRLPANISSLQVPLRVPTLQRRGENHGANKL